MMNPSVIENIFTRHGAHLSLIRPAELETSKFIDGEHIRGISNGTDPREPREPMKDAGQFDQKSAEHHHDDEDQNHHYQSHGCSNKKLLEDERKCLPKVVARVETKKHMADPKTLAIKTVAKKIKNWPPVRARPVIK